MNNAVFGKTMENVRNYVDVRLVTHWDGRYGAEALIAKPNFHSRSVFDENLMIELRKLEVQFNKPIYRHSPRVFAQHVDDRHYVVVAFVSSRVRTHLDDIRLPQVVVTAHHDSTTRNVSSRGRVKLLDESPLLDAHR
ncbi:LOW QUALITY PROTEIN: uncharacterized protein LOC112552437 [Pogonomyrmex barbatus]|uniref:LOW QUALITY PROTEIN: uncharacterized protein LOC112552437 n=1 Tax=Pogonomyrmex barbatus TaxID=144034 RepID=A0A8N1S3Z1_9HYME|nr:LOW QUALITY PROTEIN: uncharacterized protein LOC112552437 [Pogonomyrmex barbatus]